MLIEEINEIIAFEKGRAWEGVTIYVKEHPEQAEEFWETIEYLALKGNKKQRDVAFAVLIYSQHHFPDEKLDQLVKEIESCDYGRKKHILWDVISLIRRSKRVDLVSFCLRIRNWAIKVKNKSIYQTVVDCLLKLDWKKVKQDIVQQIKIGEDVLAIDTIATFIYKHGKKVYKEFYLSLDNQDKKRLDNLREEIQERYEMYKRAFEDDRKFWKKHGHKENK